MELPTSGRRSVSRYVLLLFGLCILVWVIGAMFDVQLFPGFKLFQAGLAMPMVASLLLTYHERGWAGTAVLLRRTYDVSQIRPRVWFLPILLVFPSFGVINYWALRVTGADLPPPTFSLLSVLGYGTVFFMTYGEELGLTGYALDPLQERYSALATGFILGLVWAGYHIPGFLISATTRPSGSRGTPSTRRHHGCCWSGSTTTRVGACSPWPSATGRSASSGSCDRKTIFRRPCRSTGRRSPQLLRCSTCSSWSTRGAPRRWRAGDSRGSAGADAFRGRACSRQMRRLERGTSANCCTTGNYSLGSRG